MEFFGIIIDKLIKFTPLLLKGSVITVSLTVTAVSAGVLFGLFIALGRIVKVKALNAFCWFYTWFFRGTPLLMQIFFIYYALPTIHPALNISNKFMAAWVAFTLNTAAYVAEIIRAAILSIDKGQFEAAKALGMTYGQTMKRIIIPQSYRRLIPPIGNEFIMVLKDTALVSSMGLADLMRTTNQIQTSQGDAFVYLPSMVLYLIMTTLLTYMFEKFEKKHSVYE